MPTARRLAWLAGSLALLGVLTVAGALHLRALRAAEARDLGAEVGTATVHTAAMLGQWVREEQDEAQLAAVDAGGVPWRVRSARAEPSAPALPGVPSRYLSLLQAPGVAEAGVVVDGGRLVSALGVPELTPPTARRLARAAAGRSTSWIDTLTVSPDSAVALAVVAPLPAAPQHTGEPSGALVVVLRPVDVLASSLSPPPEDLQAFSCGLGTVDRGGRFVPRSPLIASAPAGAAHGRMPAPGAPPSDGFRTAAPAAPRQVATAIRRVATAGLWTYCQAALAPAMAAADQQFAGQVETLALVGLAVAAGVAHTQGRRRRRRVAELAASEALLAAVIRSAMDAVVVVDERQQVTLFSQAAEAMFGLSAGEAVGQPLASLLPAFWINPPDGQLDETGVDRVRSVQTSEGRRVDGTTFAAEVSVAHLRVHGRSLVCAYIRDVTERDRNEAALRASERRYRDVVEGMHEGLMVTDHEHRVQFVNRRFCDVLGVTSERCVGALVEEIGRETLAEPYLPVLRAQIESRRRGEEGRYELALRQPHNGVEWLAVSAAPLCNEAGEMVGVLAVLEDITRRRQIEEALSRSEAGLREFVDNAVFGFARSAADGTVELANRALADLLGYASPGDMIGLNAGESFWYDPGARDGFLESLQAARRFSGVEVRWRKKDGTPLTVRLSGRMVAGPPGGMGGLEVIIEDVTERRRLEAQLRQAQKMEVVGQLAGGIAHDFNNLLTVIQFNADLIAGALPAERTDVLAKLGAMKGAATRGAALVRKLLVSSRRGSLELQPLDLSQELADLLAMLRPMIPEHVIFERTLEEHLPLVRADVGAVEQILLNLVTNARDAMPRGGVLRITTRHAVLSGEQCERQGWGEPGEYVCLTVEDTGSGMPDHVKERMFEPFFTTKPVGLGTGLGMAMVYGLVRQHEAFVRIESEVGSGTAVSVYFPAAPETATTMEPAPARETGAWSDVKALSGTETILLVEDEELIRETAEAMLQAHGYRVLLAADGEEALKMCLARPGAIDLVVSDAIMPRMGGPALHQALRERGIHLPFLLSTGYAPDEDRALVAGVPMLQKPWTPDGLLRSVRAIIDARPPADA